MDTNNNDTNKMRVKMRDLDTLIALNCPTLHFGLWPAFRGLLLL